MLVATALTPVAEGQAVFLATVVPAMRSPISPAAAESFVAVPLRIVAVVLVKLVQVNAAMENDFVPSDVPLMMSEKFVDTAGPSAVVPFENVLVTVINAI